MKLLVERDLPGEHGNYTVSYRDWASCAIVQDIAASSVGEPNSSERVPQII